MKRILLISIVLLAVSLAWGQTTLLNENFSALDGVTADGSTDISSTLDTVTDTDGWTGTKIYQSTGRLKMGSSSGLGSITTPTLNLSSNSGQATYSFTLLQYGSDASKLIQVLHAADGTTFVQIGADISIPSIVTTITVDIIDGTANSKIKIQAKTASSNRFYLDDILLTQGSASGIPTVTTAAISGITTISAISGGNVTSQGGSSVTARGVCWNTVANPTLGNYFSTDGSGTGSFVSNLTSLDVSTLYYVRAYATNNEGTAYGEEYSFSTSGNAPPATPVAIAATSIGANSFIANWNAATGATSYRLDVSSFSSFSTLLSSYNNLTVYSTNQTVSGLNTSTQYYYRVRAINSNGTSSNSNTISTTTLAGDIFNGYYNPVLGLSGTALKTGLHNLIDNNTYSSYDGAKDFLFQELDNVNGVVRCVYTGHDYSISSSYNGGGDPNTEHTYAQSWFGSSESSIKKADVHHLFVTNSTVNSSRGNLPFDVVTDVDNTYTYANGYVSKRGANASGNTVFEPADQHKGNLARALLYFNVRYNMTLSQGGVDMVDRLVEWHNADPVDTAELTRNTDVYDHQNNRNPFVDHPEYVASIWGGAAASTIVQFSPASAFVNEADGSISMSVQILSPSATVATTAQIVLSDGSASDVGNFATRYITFPAGSSTSQTINVIITDDSILEGTESLIFSLVSVSGGNSAAVGNYSSFNLEIEDNDIPIPLATAATNIGFTAFTANWNAAPGISEYMFDLSTSSNFSSFVAGYEDLPVSATSLAISALSEGTTYYYRLRSVFNESVGENSNPITAITNGIVYLDAPVATDATAISHEGFTAHWEPVAGADSYCLDVYSGSAATTSDLLISEYVEGSSNNKYLEIYNGTGAEVDLSNYQLKLYANGTSSPTNTNTLSGTLANGACVVYRNAGAVLTLPEGVSAIVNAATNFNGNDAVELCKISPAGSVDIFGTIGDDPGTTWGTTPLLTLNKTLRRKSTVISGVSVNPGAGFPTLATEWDSYNVDTADGLGSHIIGASAPIAGYQDLPVSINIARVSGLEAETSYSYRVRALNIGDTSENSNLIQVQTSLVLSGTGANTAIAGAATEVLVPVIAGLSSNNVVIDPAASTSDDFSLTVSAITGGIRYTLSCSNDAAFNGSYILKHTGLGYIPQTVLYTYNASTLAPASIVAGLSQTSFTISGLSSAGTGVLVIDLLQAAQNLSTPELSVAVNAGNIRLEWSPIDGATSYRIESSDNPYSGFTLLGTTANLFYEHSSQTHRFYRVIALN